MRRSTVIVALAIPCLLSLVVVPAFYDFNIPLRQLPFGFGAVTEAVARTGSLLVCPPLDEPSKYCGFAYRMPLMPYFFAGASALVGDNALHVALLKTTLLDLLLLYFLGLFLAIVGSDRLLLLLLPAVLLGPQFMLHSFSPFYEEGFLIPLLGISAVIQIAYLLGRQHELPRWARLPTYVGVTAAIYLLKSSMILMVAWNIVFALCFVRARRPVRALAAVGICLPIIAWGSVVDHMTGRFAVGTSIDGLNLLEGNNPATGDFYPQYSLDIVFGDNPIEIDGRKIEPLDLAKLDPEFAKDAWRNEWERDDAFRNAALAWATSHVVDELRLFAQKLEVFFLDIRNSPALPGHPKPPGLALAAGMTWMAIMRLVLWSAIAAAVQAIGWRPRERSLGVCWLAWLAAYAAPYLVGYGFERHVVPMLLPAALFLASLWRSAQSPAAASPCGGCRCRLYSTEIDRVSQPPSEQTHLCAGSRP